MYVKKITYDLVSCKFIKEYLQKQLKKMGTVSNNVFHGIIELYIKVKSFSTARDYVQRHYFRKVQKKKKKMHEGLDLKGKMAIFTRNTINFRETGKGNYELYLLSHS